MASAPQANVFYMTPMTWEDFTPENVPWLRYEVHGGLRRGDGENHRRGDDDKWRRQLASAILCIVDPGRTQKAALKLYGCATPTSFDKRKVSELKNRITCPISVNLPPLPPAARPCESV